jgi:hypothetical protein
MGIMIHPVLLQIGTYVGWTILLGAFWFFVRYQKNKWAAEYNIIYYSELKDIKLYRLRANNIETDMVFHQNVEVTVFGRGIFVRNPHHDVPLVKFKAETIDEVHLKNNEVKVVSNYPYALVERLIVRSDSREELATFARHAETLMRLHKRKNKKPESLLKRKIDLH